MGLCFTNVTKRLIVSIKWIALLKGAELTIVVNNQVYRLTVLDINSLVGIQILHFNLLKI